MLVFIIPLISLLAKVLGLTISLVEENFHRKIFVKMSKILCYKIKLYYNLKIKILYKKNI